VFTEHTREFAWQWDGRGVDPDLVDPEALRANWLSDFPHAPSMALLQQAWLASQNSAHETLGTLGEPDVLGSSAPLVRAPWDGPSGSDLALPHDAGSPVGDSVDQPRRRRHDRKGTAEAADGVGRIVSAQGDL